MYFLRARLKKCDFKDGNHHNVTKSDPDPLLMKVTISTHFMSFDYIAWYTLSETKKAT